MIGLVTTLSATQQGLTAAQVVDSQIELKASTEYLINTENIVTTQVFSTNDSDIEYKLNRNEDRSPQFHLRVAETNAAIQTLADVDVNSNMVSLDVFLSEMTENVVSYTEAALSSSSAVAKLYAVSEIVWVEENSAATMSLMYVQVGGNNLEKIFVDSNLAQIMDMITTGTTTTAA